MLFDDIGGTQSIAAVVDSFYHRMLDDPRVSRSFAGVELTALKAHQVAFLTVGLGGPESYVGRSLRNAHAGLGITDEMYTISIAHLGDALAEFGVEGPGADSVVRFLERMRAAIVEVQ